MNDAIHSCESQQKQTYQRENRRKNEDDEKWAEKKLEEAWKEEESY